MSKARTTGIVTAILALCITSYAVGYNAHTPSPDTSPTIGGLWLATNQERNKHNLPSLELDAALTMVATARCNDMATKHYYDHVSPTGVTPQDVMAQYTGVDITKYYSGENIADAPYTSQSVTDAWIASPEHEANILNVHYTHVGYASCGNGTGGEYVVQDFLSDAVV